MKDKEDIMKDKDSEKVKSEIAD
uniref:Uncharacterized protein n=1 Tax=Arundo donax TaxID=35708 RepID=A0A0A9C5A3_ARUDO